MIMKYQKLQKFKIKSKMFLKNIHNIYNKHLHNNEFGLRRIFL